jgi:hypothetical protein
MIIKRDKDGGGTEKKEEEQLLEKANFMCSRGEKTHKFAFEQGFTSCDSFFWQMTGTR